MFLVNKKCLLFLFAIIFFPTSSHGFGAEKSKAYYGELTERSWTAFGCSYLFGIIGWPDISEKFNKYAYIAGKEYMDAESKNLVSGWGIEIPKPEDIVIFYGTFNRPLRGMSIDFALGQVSADAAFELSRLIMRNDWNNFNNSQLIEENAKAELRTMKCDYEAIGMKYEEAKSLLE